MDTPRDEEARLSYHHVYVTTETIERTSIFDLPYGYELTCNRVGGWTLWRGDRKIAGEFDQGWLVIDVAGQVVLDSRIRPAAPSTETAP